MKEPGICSALTLSFFLHIAVITLSFLISRGLYTHKLVSPYIVSLVEPSQTAGSENVSPSGAAQEAAASEIAKPAEKPRMESPTEPRRKKESDTAIVKNRIEVLKAIQKLKELRALRKIVDIGAGQRALQSKNSSTASRNNITGSGSASAGGGDYYSLVEGKIRQQWIYPETLDTDLQTIVSIRIAKDGSIAIEKVEQGSGNQLFDRSVLRAITMASPLPPPLKEMEIGLRFRP
jgi:TonB family protein